MKFRVEYFDTWGEVITHLDFKSLDAACMFAQSVHGYVIDKETNKDIAQYSGPVYTWGLIK